MKKVFFTILGLAMATIAIRQIVLACADSSYTNDFNNNIYFHDNLIGPISYSPFYYVGDKRFYEDGYDDSVLNYLPDPNIEEWVKYGKGAFNYKDAFAWVYKSPLAASLGALINENDSFKNNSMRVWINKQPDAKQYLIYSKNCELLNAQVWNEQDWSYKQMNHDSFQNVFTEGINLFEKEKNKFLKDRYSFQLIRMSNYATAYDTSIQLANSFLDNASKEIFVYPKVISLQGGNYYKKHDYNRAAYYFAQSYALGQDKISDYNSYTWCFRNGDKPSASIEKILSFAKNEQEKANIYLLQGLSVGADDLFNMYGAYRANPKLEALGIMLSRNISSYEQTYWSKGFDQPFYQYGYYYYNNDQESTQSKINRQKILDSLIQFTSLVVKEKKSPNQAFYALALSHLYLMQQNMSQAQLYLNMAGSLSPDDRVSGMIKAEHLLLTTLSASKIDANVEKELVPSIKWMRDKANTSTRYAVSYKAFMQRFLMNKYLVQGDSLKAVMAYLVGDNLNSDGYYWPRYTYTDGDYKVDTTNQAYYKTMGLLSTYTYTLNKLSQDNIFKLIAFSSAVDGSEYEKWLRSEMPLTVSVENRYLGTRFLLANNYKDAEPLFKKLNKAENDAGIWDPFNLQLRDVPTFDSNVVRYSLHKYVVIMDGLLTKINNNTATAEEIFQFANAKYALSYYGGSGGVVDIDRSYSDYNAYFKSKETPDIEKISNNYYSAKEAFKYYELSYKKATDPELKAKCLFGMSKCWQKWGTVSDKYSFSNEEEYFARSTKSPYLIQLSKEYSNTKAYKQFSEDCAALGKFIAKKPNSKRQRKY